MGKKSKKPDKPELQFVWGTFCRKILEVPGRPERSLIDVVPALKMRIFVQLTGDGKEIPSLFTIDLGDLGAYGNFKVLSNHDEPLELESNVVIQLPDRELNEKSIFKIHPDVKYSQQANRLNNVMIKLPFEDGMQEHVITVSWNIDSKEIGKVELPLEVDFKIERK